MAESKLLLRVRQKKTIEDAWAAIQRNARTSKSQDTKNEAAEFAANLSTNLRRIRDQLRQDKFVFARARGVRIPKSKNPSDFRPLVVASVESRIVQRAVHDVLVSVPAITRFVRTPYSYGGIKKETSDELSAVPAAIRGVLEAIGGGGEYIIRSDIAKFFTRIPKPLVTRIVSEAVVDDKFTEFFKKAIAVELENMSQLREHAKAFPIEDIGVAQGNSLSPLLGNLVLYEFDMELNKSDDVRCIRYIDDFIIIAPSKDIAENTFSKSLSILKNLGMNVSQEKTKRAHVSSGFEFLGIHLSSGFIRPSRKAQQNVIDAVKGALTGSQKAFREHRKTGELPRNLSLLHTLTKVSGITQGWGKHYYFCNDNKSFERIDARITELIRQYLAVYRDEREKVDDAGRWRLLGIENLAALERKPFQWPKVATEHKE